MTTNTAVDAGTGADLAKATVEVLYAPQGYGFRRSLGLWTGGETGTGTAEILSREMSVGIGSLGQPVLGYTDTPAYADAPVLRLSLREAEPSYVRVYDIGGGVSAFSPTASPIVVPGEYSMWAHAEQFMGGSPGLIQGLPGAVLDPAPELLHASKYVQTAMEEFRRLNAAALLASPRVLGSVVQILNLSVRRGYHPVATLDETDNSLEIEARLDPNRLLLLQVWPSGAADGLIFSDAEGFKSIEATMVSDVVDRLVSSKDVEKPGHSFHR